MRTLYLLSALPGSGKSTWAKRFKEKHQQAKIVSSDSLRTELLGKVDDFSAEKLIWDTFLERIHEYGKEEGAIVIADSTNLTNHYRTYYLDKTPEFDRHVLVLFDLSFDQCERLNDLREGDKRVPLEAMRRMERQFEPLSKQVEARFDEVIHVGVDFVLEAFARAKK